MLGAVVFNCQSSANFRATFYEIKIYVLMLTETGLGHILGYFWTN
jgi:hypothetical protein